MLMMMMNKRKTKSSWQLKKYGQKGVGREREEASKRHLHSNRHWAKQHLAK